MRHIDKTKAILPPSFLKWLRDNDADLQDKINNPSVAGSQIWTFFSQSTHVLRELKEALVAYQGYICCYCGQKIDPDGLTKIEHLFAKSKKEYKHLTLDFYNLLASCMGGCKLKAHVVKSGETLEKIAALYSVDVEYLLDVWVNADEIKLFRERYDIENLSAGDRIVIFPVLPEPQQHCDTKKKNDEIDIHPLQIDCQDYFSYNPMDGKVRTTKRNELTVERLGLNNNRYINQLRKNVIEERADIIMENLVRDFRHSPSVFHSNKMQIIDNLNDFTKRGGKLDPFVFVIIWRLNNY